MRFLEICFSVQEYYSPNIESACVKRQDSKNSIEFRADFCFQDKDTGLTLGDKGLSFSSSSRTLKRENRGRTHLR